MEDKVAELAAKVQALEASHSMLGAVDTEIFYWWTLTIMIAIHAGFFAYEMGASRRKNVLASGIKNILAFAFIMPTFFFFGWWIYLAFPTGLTPSADGAAGLPWNAAMGPNLTDNATGVFWGAFALFAATTASIFSGAVIERIRISSFAFLAVILGSVLWILAGAWGWHPDGWLTTKFGYHDAGCSGVIHAVAGFFALGVLINLGPRIGKFNADGTANDIPPHNVPLAIIGLMLIIMGFFGFLGACAIVVPGEQWTNIYGQPMTLSAYAFNTLMAFAGGVIGAWVFTRDPFWMMSGGLAGIISAAAGLDVYYPPVAFVIAFIGGSIIAKANSYVTKAGIDDAVGAVAVHGICGVWGVIAVVLFAAGYPNVAEGAPATGMVGQLVGLLVFIPLGFVPGYGLSYILKKLDLLRVPADVELAGLDIAEVPIEAYAEEKPMPVMPGGAMPAPAE